jgi:hypothetical protein
MGGLEEMDLLEKEDGQEWTGLMWLRMLSCYGHFDAVVSFQIS